MYCTWKNTKCRKSKTIMSPLRNRPEDSNEKNKNVYGIFLHMFLKNDIYIWIQQINFGRKQKYLWKRFYTLKKPLKKGLQCWYTMKLSPTTYHRVKWVINGEILFLWRSCTNKCKTNCTSMWHILLWLLWKR